MRWMGQKDVLGLQITVNDFVAFQEYKTVQHLLREAADEFERESSELMDLDEFV